MEGCAETLIPNPQKPRFALITEDAAAPFSASRVWVSSLWRSVSSFQKYYRRQVVKWHTNTHICCTKWAHSHLQYNGDGGVVDVGFCTQRTFEFPLPARKPVSLSTPKSIFPSSCLTVKRPHLWSTESCLHLGNQWEMCFTLWLCTSFSKCQCAPCWVAACPCRFK